MNHILCVSKIERFGDLGEEAPDLVQLDRSPLDPFAQVAPLEPAHDQEAAVTGVPIIVERHDKGMLEPGDQLGLDLKPFLKIRVPGELGKDHLEGDLPTHRTLAGSIDDPEPTNADALDQLITLDRSPAKFFQGSLAPPGS